MIVTLFFQIRRNEIGLQKNVYLNFHFHVILFHLLQKIYKKVYTFLSTATIVDGANMHRNFILTDIYHRAKFGNFII